MGKLKSRRVKLHQTLSFPNPLPQVQPGEKLIDLSKEFPAWMKGLLQSTRLLEMALKK